MTAYCVPACLVGPLRKVRAVAMRSLNPKVGYFLFDTTQRCLEPISTKYGFDRGQPIERYYIESFLKDNRESIRGVCLEIHDNDYTRRFGGDRVTGSDVLDIDTRNRQASIFADLRNAKNVPSDTYDCLIITQTLGMIDDYHSAIKECHRVLKPAGTLLVTGSATGPVFAPGTVYWRMTVDSARYAFEKHFSRDNLVIQSYGNVLSGQCFWVGLASDELTPDELDYHDPNFPVIIAVKARK